MKKTIIYLLIIIIGTLYITSCKKQPPPVQKTGFSYVIPYINESSYTDDGILRVFIDTYTGPTFSHTLNYINERMAEFGFKLEFVSYVNEKYRTDIMQLMDDYSNYIVKNIDNNIVFLYSAAMPWWHNKNAVNELLKAGKLKNLYETARLNAPDWLAIPKITNLIDNDKLFEIPMGFRKLNYPNNLAVLVQNDIAEEYGNEIRTVRDYYDLLIWLKMKEPKKIPGVACEINDHFGIIPDDLFLRDYGYFNLSRGNTHLIDINTLKVTPTLLVDEFRQSHIEFATWQRNGLIQIEQEALGTNIRDRFTGYPTIILYADDLITYENTFYYHSNNLDSFLISDMRDFTMYILYNDQPVFEWNTETPQYKAIAGNNADLTDFFRLQQWLTNEDNYRKLFYGDEGVDYEVENGRIMVKNESETRYWERVRLTLFPFQNPAFFTVYPKAPLNFEEEMEARKLNNGITLSDEEQSILNNFDINIIPYIKNTYMSYLTLFTKVYAPMPDVKYNSYHWNQFVFDPPAGEEETIELIDNFLNEMNTNGGREALLIDAMKYHEVLFNETNGIMQSILNR